jgi:hypothetical protein
LQGFLVGQSSGGNVVQGLQIFSCGQVTGFCVIQTLQGFSVGQSSGGNVVQGLQIFSCGQVTGFCVIQTLQGFSVGQSSGGNVVQGLQIFSCGQVTGFCVIQTLQGFLVGHVGGGSVVHGSYGFTTGQVVQFFVGGHVMLLHVIIGGQATFGNGFLVGGIGHCVTCGQVTFCGTGQGLGGPCVVQIGQALALRLDIFKSFDKFKKRSTPRSVLADVLEKFPSDACKQFALSHVIFCKYVSQSL